MRATREIEHPDELRRGGAEASGPKRIPYEAPREYRNFLFMPHFIYILECADKSLYIGCTNNLEKRLKEHSESKRGAHYTKIRRPVILKYSEEHKTLAVARKREAQLKSWTRKKKLSLIN